MKKIILALAVLMSMVYTACNNINTKQPENINAEMEETVSLINATPQQLEGIEKALNAYVEAAIKGNSEIAKPAFAETATMSFNENGKLVSVPIQALYDYYDQTGPHSAKYEITSAHIAEDVAIVSIDSKFGDVEFDDMFTLVKDGDDWKIVSKIYHVK